MSYIKSCTVLASPSSAGLVSSPAGSLSEVVSHLIINSSIACFSAFADFSLVESIAPTLSLHRPLPKLIFLEASYSGAGPSEVDSSGAESLVIDFLGDDPFVAILEDEFSALAVSPLFHNLFTLVHLN